MKITILALFVATLGLAACRREVPSETVYQPMKLGAPATSIEHR